MDIDEAIRLDLERRRPQLDLDTEWITFQQRRSRRQLVRRLGRGVAAAVVVLAAGVGTIAVLGDDEPSRVDTGPSTTGPSTTSPGRPDTWRALPEAPLSPRSFASGAWTGTEMVIVGGTDAPPCPPNADCAGTEDGRLRDGAAYNPSTDSWRTIAPPPIPFAQAPAVWTGEVVLFFVNVDVQEARLLSYDPVDDVWEELAGAPAWVHDAGWTGELVVVASVENSSGRQDWTYDPSNDEWRALPADPIGCARERSITPVRGRLVLTAIPCSDSPGTEPSLYRAASFDLANQRWRPLPDSQISEGNAVWIASGDRLVNPWTGFVDGGEVDPYDRPYPKGGILDLATETWEELPQPSESGDSPVRYTGAADAWVAAGGDLYSPSKRVWHQVPAAPHHGHMPTAVWTGEEIILWGGTAPYYDGHVATGAAYTPPPG